jgi:hypothetical protein
MTQAGDGEEENIKPVADDNHRASYSAQQKICGVHEYVIQYIHIVGDWYLIEQLRQYADGVCGVHTADSYRQQMRAISSTFVDPSTRHNIAAYINSLAR